MTPRHDSGVFKAPADVRARLNQLEGARERFEEETRAQLQAILSSGVEEAAQITEQIQQVVYALDGLWTEAAPGDKAPGLVVFLEHVLDAARGFRDEAAALPRSITHLAELGQNPDVGDDELAAIEQAEAEIAHRLAFLRAEREQFGTMSAQLLAIPAPSRSELLGQVTVHLRAPVRVQHILRAFDRERRRRYERRVDKAADAIAAHDYKRAAEHVARAVQILPEAPADEVAGDEAVDLGRYRPRRRALDLADAGVRLGSVTFGIVLTALAALGAVAAHQGRGELVARARITTTLTPAAAGKKCEEHPAGWRLDCASKKRGACDKRCVSDGLRVGVFANSGRRCWARMGQLAWRVPGEHKKTTDAMNQACLRQQGRTRYQRLVGEVRRHTRSRQWGACIEVAQKALATPGITNKSELEAAHRTCAREQKGRTCTFLAEKLLQAGQLDRAAPEVLRLRQCGGKQWKQEQRRLLKQLYWRQTVRYLAAIQGAANRRAALETVVAMEKDRDSRLKTRQGQGRRAAELKHPKVLKHVHPSRRVLVPLEIGIDVSEPSPPRRLVVSFSSCAAPNCEHRRARPQPYQLAWCLSTGLERYVLCQPLPMSRPGWKP